MFRIFKVGWLIFSPFHYIPPFSYDNNSSIFLGGTRKSCKLPKTAKCSVFRDIVFKRNICYLQCTHTSWLRMIAGLSVHTLCDMMGGGAGEEKKLCEL